MIRLIRSKNFDDDVKQTTAHQLSMALKHLTDDYKIRKCIEYGADIFYRDLMGRSILFYNVHTIFLHRGVSPFITDNKGNTCLFFINTLNAAKKIIKYINEKGANVEQFINHQNENGETALFHSELKEYLLLLGADPNISDKKLNTPIYYASSLNDFNLLFNNGANIYTVNDMGDTPLFYINDVNVA